MSEELDVTESVIQPGVLPHKDITKLGMGTSISLVGRVTGGGLHFLTQVVLARLLGPEAFGLYGIGWTILRIAGFIAPLGLQNGVIRFGSRYWRKNNAGLKSVLVQSIGLTFFSSLLIGSVLFLCAPWLAQQVFQKPDLTPVLRWFVLALPLLAGLRVAAAATRISQRMKFSTYAEDMSQPAANLLLILFFFVLGYRLLGAVVAAVCSFGFAFLLVLFYVTRLFPEALSVQQRSGSSLRELFVFSLPTAFVGIFAILILRVDRLFIAYFCPAADVGVYQALSQLPMLFFIVVSALNAILAPMIADLYHKQEMSRLEELFRVSTKWGLYLSLPIFLVLCFAPHEIMTIIFGNEYARGALPLVILSVGILFIVGTGAVGFLLIMTGHQKSWLVIYSVMFIVNILLNWLLIPLWGLMGAALATASSASGLFLSGLFQVRRSLGLWPYDYRYFKVLLSTGLSIVALFLLRFIIDVSPVFSLLLTMIVSASVFGGTLLLLGLDAEDREFVRLIRVRFVG